MSGPLHEKVALVTGGSRGIGQAIAIELAAAGAAVAFTYKTGADGAAETQKQIEELGGKGRATACDVADFEAVEALVAEVTQSLGPITIAVNNAGITATSSSCA